MDEGHIGTTAVRQTRLFEQFNFDVQNCTLTLDHTFRDFQWLVEAARNITIHRVRVGEGQMLLVRGIELFQAREVNVGLTDRINRAVIVDEVFQQRELQVEDPLIWSTRGRRKLVAVSELCSETAVRILRAKPMVRKVKSSDD